MRIWHCRATACTTSSPAEMRSRSTSVGWTAYRSARAPTTSNERSVIGRCLRRARAHLGEEGVERGARLGPSVEALPQPAQLPDQLVARVDRHDEALGLAGAVVDADEQRLDVRRHVGELGVVGDEIIPGVERQQRLGRSGRARVERGDLADGGVEEEEGDADRDLHGVPARR